MKYHPKAARLRLEADAMDLDANYHGHSDQTSTELMDMADNLCAEADRLEAAQSMPTPPQSHLGMELVRANS